jgi:hypothetical protein
MNNKSQQWNVGLPWCNDVVGEDGGVGGDGHEKLSSGPEKGKQTNELDHTCYNNQQVPNAFYRWPAYGLAAWAHLVPWD